MKNNSWETFKRWFGLGALMFGTFCGANMASGVYAASYIVPLGGGWAMAWLGMFIVAMAFFCIVGLNFIRSFKVNNYKDYYLALYGLHKPEANPILKTIVMVFFDVYTSMLGLITVSSCIALLAELMNSLLGIPTAIACAGGVVLFAVLTIYGAAFLRKFNTVMTISLIVSIVAILISVLAIKGDVLAERIGNFNIGPDWGLKTVGAQFSMILSYCFTNSTWGATLSNYADQIKTRKDAVGAGVLIALLVSTLFIMTGMVVLPFMPDVYAGTPILMICQQYLSPVLTIIYWAVVVLSVVSTAPSFTFNVANRWAMVWKAEKLSMKAKFFIISMVFLLACWILSGVGLMTIVQKGYVMMGDIALYAIVIPLVISIFRVWKKDKEEAAA